MSVLMSALMWHVKRHHSALVVDLESPAGAGCGGALDCVETLRDGVDNLPQDETKETNADHQIDTEELKPLTGDWSVSGPGNAGYSTN